MGGGGAEGTKLGGISFDKMVNAPGCTAIYFHSPVINKSQCDVAPELCLYLLAPTLTSVYMTWTCFFYAFICGVLLFITLCRPQQEKKSLPAGRLLQS